MPKMTKAQTRRRLVEASEKIWKVMGSQGFTVSNGVQTTFTAQENKKLMDAREFLLKLARKLK